MCQAARTDMRRTILMHESNKRHVTVCRGMTSAIDAQMDAARREIDACKAELAQAKEQRRHRQEYDLMARMIEKYPDREDLRQKLAVVKAEIDKVRTRQTAMIDRLELAKKKFYALGALLKNFEIEPLIDTQLRQVGEAHFVGNYCFRSWTTRSRWPSRWTLSSRASLWR